MKKSKLIKKNSSNKFSALRMLILALAVISLLALIFYSFQYVQSNKKIVVIKQTVDKQVGLSAQFYPEYIKSVHGDVQMLGQHISQFDGYLAEEKKQTSLLADSEQSRLDSVASNWNSLKRFLSASPKPQIDGSVVPNAQEAEKRINQIRNNLFKLKDAYQAKVSSPFDPITTLIVLAILSVLLFALWVLLQLRNNQEIQKEATRLHIEAENRSERDQGAILRLMDDMAGLSEGDLTIEAQVTEDFTGAVADSVNFAVENMREMVGTIIRTSDELTRATKDTQGISQLLKESSKQQSTQISKANDTARSMATSLHEIAENTDASVEIARSSVDIAQEGRARVMSTVKSMTDIRENIQDTSKRIKRLGESSQEIGDIVEIIKSIADQTNVLALNAAIQATSAGEAGRGFAVVADEVQQLAERSANATKRIEILVKTIQADANEAIASMESSTTQVVTGASIAEEAGQSLDKIENVSQNLANLIVNVSQATRNAAGMAGKVAVGMDKLSELSQQAVGDVGKSVQSIDNLEGLSVSLKESVSDFKLPQ